MDKKTDQQALPWFITLDEANRQDLGGRLEANDAQRAYIARLLDLEALDRLALDYALAAIGNGRFRLSGAVQADVSQTCVVTLAPVPQKIDELVEVEFWPKAQLSEPNVASAHQFDQGDPAEPIVAGRLDIGRIAYETFVTALDPYPRAPAAEFAWAEKSDSAEPGDANPFAILKWLKPS